MFASRGLLFILACVGCWLSVASAPLRVESREDFKQTLLTQLRESPDEAQRAGAVWGIMTNAFWGEEVVLALRRALKDESELVRKSAVVALGRLEEQSAPAVPDLIEMIESGTPEMQLVIIRTLSRIGGEAASAVPVLKNLAQEASVAALSARFALFRITGESQRHVRVLANVVRRSSSVDLRAGAAQILGEFGAAAEEAVPALVEALKHDEFLTRLLAARSLGQIARRPNAAIPALEEAIHMEEEGATNSGTTADVRLLAIASLGKFKDQRGKVEPILFDIAERGQARLRASAIRVLGEIGTREERFNTLLQDALEGVLVTEAALDALAQMERPLPDLSEAVAQVVRTAWLRESALDVLDRIGGPSEKIVPFLIEALTDRDPGIRGQAARALGKRKYRTEEVVAALSEALSDEHYWVVDAAVESLGELGRAAKSALPKLKRIAEGVRLEPAQRPSRRKAEHAITRIEAEE